MHNSKERVWAVIEGRMPDRAPLYDLLRNDAVINHFTGRKLTVENAPEVVYAAYEPAIDATRSARLPDHEHTEVLSDGRQVRYFRWTAWTARHPFRDANTWAEQKRQWLDTFDPSWNREKQAGMEHFVASNLDTQARLGEVFWLPGGRMVGLQGLYGEIGFENFVYCLTDYPDLVDELLVAHLLESEAWIAHIPQDFPFRAYMCGDDIAFNTQPFLRPAWFEQHYAPLMARICDAFHERGYRVMFHSDGNLLSLMDMFVEAGIDGLNPLEVLAGMDPILVHQRWPNLFLCGGIDVSQLLPLGTPDDIKDQVKRVLHGCEGRIMVGSSTELNNKVPLENYLALRDAVLENPY